MSKHAKKIASVTFANVQSNSFRVVHADGITFTLNAQKLVHLLFFSERPSLPERQSFAIAAGDTLGEEILSDRVTKSTWTRESEVDVVLSRELAERLYSILGEHLRGKKDNESPAD